MSELDMISVLASGKSLVIMAILYVIMFITYVIMFYWQWKQAKVKNIQERMLDSVLIQEGLSRNMLYELTQIRKGKK